jgi:peptidoglycan/xylan/chitin deacetylase (PgdA/CDA1 family)
VVAEEASLMASRTISWPGAAQVAVLVTVDFDAELFWLRLDPSVAERPKTRSIGEYGGRRGAPRLLDVLGAAGVPSTWFVCSDLVDTYRDVIERAAAEGHCIASRGPGLTDFASAPLDEQRAALVSSRDVIARATGTVPAGFRPPGDIRDETITLLLEAGYRWSSITRGDDRPLLLGTGRPGGSTLVDIPRSWDLDDAGRFLFNYGPAFPPGQCRISPYGSVLADWIAEFDATRELGLCYVLSLEPQAIGTPGRIDLLEELLAHITSCPDVWLATGDAVEAFWRGHGEPAEPGPEEIRRRARGQPLQEARSPSNTPIALQPTPSEQPTPSDSEVQP